jgi:acyl-CoA thioesterase I
MNRRIVVLLALSVALGAAAQTPPPTWRPEPDQLAQLDWPQLYFYRDENRQLPPPTPGRPRVIFLGDSITASWNVADVALPGAEVINRGIGGQTTPQMLVRFRQDVVDLKPAVVHILAGTNDLAGNTGPTSLEAIEGNISSMVEIAQANHIGVVLASVLPTLDYPWRRGLDPAPRIAALNTWMRAFARRRGLVYVDYFPALADPSGGLKADLAKDGVHPNQAGYDVMAPLARQAIARAVRAHRR